MKTSNDDSSPTIHLSITRDEASTLRYALDHGLCSISEAHPEDRALLRALIERLESAEKKSRRTRSRGGPQQAS